MYQEGRGCDQVYRCGEGRLSREVESVFRKGEGVSMCQQGGRGYVDRVWEDKCVCVYESVVGKRADTCT